MTGGYVVPVDPATSEGLKKKNAGPRSWILLDSSGEEIILDVDKYEIMHRVQIHTRDLRILDPLLLYPSAILGRERAIVLNLEHIKAIITADERWKDLQSSSTGKRKHTVSTGITCCKSFAEELSWLPVALKSNIRHK